MKAYIFLKIKENILKMKVKNKKKYSREIHNEG